MKDMSENAERPVVVPGGSIAGLLAAKVLAKSGADVTVVDRDRLSDVDGARRGVPQDRHTHGLLARGQQVLEELFPGLTDELTAAGAESGDLGSQLRWIFNGRRLRPAESGLLVVGGYRPRGGFLTKLSDGRCIVSLTGVLGDHAPTDPERFLDYARSLPVPDIYEAIRDTRPLEEDSTFRYPTSIRRRYDKLARFPDSRIVLGDAACGFNPVYGQGITVAALQALTLRKHPRRGVPVAPRRFFRDIAKVLDAPWEIAAGGDLAFPGAEGRRTLKSRIANAYTGKLHAAASVDARITAVFVRVAGLVDPPTAPTATVGRPTPDQDEG